MILFFFSSGRRAIAHIDSPASFSTFFQTRLSLWGSRWMRRQDRTFLRLTQPRTPQPFRRHMRLVAREATILRTPLLLTRLLLRTCFPAQERLLVTAILSSRPTSQEEATLRTPRQPLRQAHTATGRATPLQRRTRLPATQPSTTLLHLTLLHMQHLTHLLRQAARLRSTRTTRPLGTTTHLPLLQLLLRPPLQGTLATRAWRARSSAWSRWGSIATE